MKSMLQEGPTVRTTAETQGVNTPGSCRRLDTGGNNQGQGRQYQGGRKHPRGGSEVNPETREAGNLQWISSGVLQYFIITVTYN